MNDLSAQNQELERQNQQLLDAYAKLDKALAQYAELYDFAPVGYLTLGQGRRIVKANLTCCELLQRDRVVLQGKDLLDFVLKEDRPALVDYLGRLCQGTGKIHCEVRLHNDTPVLLESTVSKEQGECRIVMLDISRQKKAEAALRESEKRFKALVEVTSDWVWEVNAEGVYTYASPKVFDLLGYTPEEVVGKTPFDFMPRREADRLLMIFGELIARREPFHNMENLNLRKDGREVLLETSAVPIFDTEGAFCGFRGIDRDISNRLPPARE
ncbi:PAS domain S-box protein [Geomonas subterranea]|uniref:PAS domain S-box protein n=1 Tax=Geomonas subterranea TaxID=2847989 RepID=A0ABX8LNH7_9BACT|nr:PAS domain S-box protein [Geomonas subterranea]QXE92476.1 PAS domain S-box protein [Geomonas subterranea]QXM09425.1 PAS domain S-box protein [Geomonas subterranea]